MNSVKHQSSYILQNTTVYILPWVVATYHTSYFMRNVKTLVLHYCVTWDFITTKLSFWGTVPPSFRDTIPGLAPSLIKSYIYFLNVIKISYLKKPAKNTAYFVLCSLVVYYITVQICNWTDIFAVSGNAFATRAAIPHPYDAPTFKTNAFHLVSNVYGGCA